MDNSFNRKISKCISEAVPQMGTPGEASRDEADIVVPGTEGLATFSTDNGINGFSQFIVTNHSTILPVELLDFSVRLTDEHKALAEWSTAEEIGTDHFIVERSADGATFEELGSVTATGGPGQIANYDFIDPKPLRGVSYYRLRIVDLDGSYSYSDIDTLVWDALPSDLVVFPNPVLSEEVLIIETNNYTALEVEIFNAAGQLMRVQSPEGYRHEIELEQLAAGSYFYRINNGLKDWVGRL